MYSCSRALIISLNKASLKYENYIVMGDLDIDIHAGLEKDKLDDFRNLFDLSNFVKDKICCTSSHKFTIDLILTNRSPSFFKTIAPETGLSDFQLMTSACFKFHYS